MTSEEKFSSPATPEDAAAILRQIARADSIDRVNSLAKSPASSLPVVQTMRMDEARYRMLIELLPAVTFMASFEEGLNDVYVSPQVESILGYTQQEWVEDPVLWYERLHPDDRNRWNKEFAQTVAFATTLRSAYRFLARDGRTVWLHTEARIIRDERGVPLFIQGIGVDVTKMKEAEQSTIEYADKLERTNRELEQFAYVASHDLQEPLRSITSYTQLILQEFGSSFTAETRHYFDRVVEASGRLKNLIQALLEFSRVGKGDLKLEPTRIDSILNQVIENLYAAITESNATITADPLPLIFVDRTYISMLFQNLIGNAIKFRSDRPPAIHISATHEHDCWRFSVRDNGIGIDPQYKDKIFIIFQRLHTQERYPGTGIGLAVSKKIVDLHRGKIWLESAHGEGSTFYFEIPDRFGRGVI